LEQMKYMTEAQMQDKLASICEDICKDVGANPKYWICPNSVKPDLLPGVMIWDALLEQMECLTKAQL